MAKIKTDAIVILVEFGKAKILAQGVLAECLEARVCSEEGYEIGVLCRGGLKRLRAADSGWVVEELMPKKLTLLDVTKHEWLSMGRCLFATQTQIYIV